MLHKKSLNQSELEIDKAPSNKTRIIKSYKSNLLNLRLKNIQISQNIHKKTQGVYIIKCTYNKNLRIMNQKRVKLPELYKDKSHQ